jgi:alkylhydroperoxidase family enzyme
MSRVPLAEPEVLSTYLRDLHDGAREADWSTRHVARAFAPAPDLLQLYLENFYYPWHSNTGIAADKALLEPRLKELMRLRIATLNGCKTCKAARLAQGTLTESEARAVDEYDDAPTYSDREKAAIKFAEMLAINHHDIDDESIALMRQLFDPAELLELMMMAGQYIGFGRMLAVLQLETIACPI